MEQLRRVAANGTMVGPAGFVRGSVPRSAPGFKDDIFVNRMPPNGRAGGPVILDSDRICAKDIGDYSAGQPMLTASPGDFIAIRHLENGHVSKPNVPENKPRNSGTIYIYGTSEPANSDTLLAIHKKWNAEGTGGDGRGRLLATRNYDDGQCYEANDSPISQDRQVRFKKQAADPMGANLWCQADIQLPDDLPAGKTYSIYWVWDWPTLDPAKIDIAATASDQPKAGQFPTQGEGVIVPEVYTSCAEIQITARSKGESNLAISFDKNQDLNFAAVEEQLNTRFQVQVPSGGTDNNNPVATQVPSATTKPTRTRTRTSPSRSTSTSGGNRGDGNDNGSGNGNGNGNGNGGRVRTKFVTVTVEPKTVTQMVTVTVGAAQPVETKETIATAPVSSSSSPSSSRRAIQTGIPLVSPFLKARATGHQRRKVAF
jgi:hypothetical protein